MADISDEVALKIYHKITEEFNSGKPKTQKELNELVGDKSNFYSVLVSILIDISRYSYITGSQCSNLIICIVLAMIPEFEKLIILEQDSKRVELEKEIDRLTKLLINGMFEDSNDNTDG